MVCRLILLGGVGMGVFSCSTYRTFSVEILQPAKVYLEPGTHIALLDRNLKSEGSVGRLLGKYADMDRHNLFLEFANGMKQVFAGAPFFDTLIPLAVETERLWEQEHLPRPMNADTIRHLAEEFNLDYIAVVELQYYRSEQKSFRNIWFVRLYEATNGQIIDSVLLSSQLDWDRVEEMEFPTSVLDGAWDKGVEFAQRIMPYWEETERRVYDGGKVLGMGDAFYKDDKMEEAEQVWQGAMQLSPKMALRAAINLAWLAENAGEFRKAADLLEEARKLAYLHHLRGNDVNYLQQYIRLIDLRIKRNQILDRQIIPENY